MLQLTPTTSIDSFATASSSMEDTYPGVYRIECASTGMCADLSGQNFRSVIGFKTHDGDNQRWEITALGAGFAIRSVYSGAYLTVELKNESRVVIANMFPVSWDIRSVDAQRSGLYRIRWPDTEYVLTLDGGDLAPLHLARQDSHGTANQMWRLQDCESRRDLNQEGSGITTVDQGQGRLVIDVDKFDAGKGQLVVSTTTTTKIRRVLGF